MYALPMIIVAKESTIKGTNIPFTGSLISRRLCCGYTDRIQSELFEN
jgi:hypothetical protein